MRVLVISSCTGEKAVHRADQLTLDDFRQGSARVAERERALADLLTPAETLYTGLQHQRLMAGVRELRERARDIRLDLHILSAGYGLVPADRRLAPYEATFSDMGKPALRAWADQLEVPAAVRGVLAEPYDFGLVLLGNEYLEACRLGDDIRLGGPTLLICGANMAKTLPRLPRLRLLALSNAEAKRFSCALIGLKGELAARILRRLADGPALAKRLFDPARSPLDLLADDAPAKVVRGKARPNPKVDQVITLPESWHNKPHRARLRYFIPEWDDLVDPDYDFATDTHAGGSGDWSNEVYAHQMYPEPNYDGLLVSKVVAEKSRKKKERINALGVHRFLRVPREFPVMGDCGAFGYIAEDEPPYSTDEILDYYTRLDFDYGVSIDHLIVTSTEAQKQHRYQLTIHNAETFLREHQARGLPWTPIGAVQGWDPQSYAEAARQYAAMGYQYIALGGLVRTPTKEILRVLDAVHQVVPGHVHMHLFGLARLGALHDFARLGVRSVDSASYLRQAWMRDSDGIDVIIFRGNNRNRAPRSGQNRALEALVPSRAGGARCRLLRAVQVPRAAGHGAPGAAGRIQAREGREGQGRALVPAHPDPGAGRLDPVAGGEPAPAAGGGPQLSGPVPSEHARDAPGNGPGILGEACARCDRRRYPRQRTAHLPGS